MSISAKSIFMDAIELPRSERDGFIGKACGEQAELRARVDALLRAHDGASTMLGEPARAVPASVDELQPGALIQDYTLVEEIGSGGFGNVWLAEQKRPLQRLVAIKVIKAGMDSREVVARFDAERQALALMDHPAIAKVFDGGTTPRGRPYFAMELVNGLPITEYCNEQGLGTRARVQLAVQVCQGLKHAHQKGVIHRDIKPSNVLVIEQDGKLQAKIIDFGIAKAIGGRLSQATFQTRIDQMIGTPGYMSPEQLGESADIDTRSDVYSVGALLYELLTDELPLDLSDSNLAAVQAKIAREEPVRPSTRLGSKSHSKRERPRLPLREVRGDLDWIVMRCLEKDRERRYESIGLLAADLGRYLDGEVVEAGPPTMRYRASKFVRRNWRALFVAAAMFAVLITATLVSTRQARIAELARRDAEAAGASMKEELVRASAVADFLESLLTSIDPAMAAGRDTSIIREVLEQATDNVEEASRGVPSVEVQLRSILGGARFSVGEFAAAREQLERAFELCKQVYGENDLASLQIGMTLGAALAEEGDFERAKEILTWTYAGYQAAVGPDHADTRLALANLTAMLTDRGSPQELEPVLRELERVTTLDNGPDHEDSLRVRNNLAVLLSNNGQREEAKELLESIAAVQREQLTLDHPRTMATMNNLAGIYEEMGQFEDAERIFRELLEAKTRVLPEGHPSLLIGQNNLAHFLDDHGDRAEAAELRRHAIESSLEHHGLENRFTLTLLIGEGLARLEDEDYAEAEAALQQVVDHAAPVFGKNSRAEITGASNLAEVLVATGRASEACDLMAPYIGAIPETFAESDSTRAIFSARYGLMLHAAGRLDEARPYLEQGRADLAGDDKHKKCLDRLEAALRE